MRGRAGQKLEGNRLTQVRGCKLLDRLWKKVRYEKTEDVKQKGLKVVNCDAGGRNVD